MAKTTGHGNPRWTRDETILALDLYFRCDGRIPSSNDERVIKLSTLLQHFPYYTADQRKASFRNPDGVSFKLQNLRQVATGKGLGNVSEMDRSIWKDFGENPERVHALALLIAKAAPTMSSEAQTVDDDDEAFVEGALLTRLHKARERSRRLRPTLLASRRRLGRLSCDLCGCGPMTPDKTLEDAIFEAHHIVPLAELFERRTTIKDSALLCASCHRLLHRAIASRKQWLTIAQAKALWREMQSEQMELTQKEGVLRATAG